MQRTSARGNEETIITSTALIPLRLGLAFRNVPRRNYKGARNILNKVSKFSKFGRIAKKSVSHKMASIFHSALNLQCSDEGEKGPPDHDYIMVC